MGVPLRFFSIPFEGMTDVVSVPKTPHKSRQKQKFRELFDGAGRFGAAANMILD